MRRGSTRLVLPVVSLALLAVAGCSEGAPAASGSPAGRSAGPTPTPTPPPSRTPAPSATPTATAAPTPVDAGGECVDTKAMDTGKRARYLAGLKSTSGSYGSKALTIDGDGLNFRPEQTERPCEAVEVRLSRFWVDMTRASDAAGRPRTSPTAPTYEFRYTLMDRPSLSVGPEDGIAKGSVPPDSTGCRGSLSVVHVGHDIPIDELPDDLRMPTSFTAAGRGAMDVKVEAEGTLAATFVPPSGTSFC